MIANEFRFLGGSIGCAAAARITAAVRRATAERLPILATAASGGTRMQEGTPAFVQMVEISHALMTHRAAGLPYLAYLRHPTTGGVYASWGSLAHLTIAQPGALIGFLGPKVYQALNDAPFPEGVQTAENLAAKGVIDAVVPPEDLPLLVDRTLSVLVDEPDIGLLSRRGGMPVRRWAEVGADHSHPIAVFCDDVVVRPTILIVDDHRAFRAAATVMLEGEGFAVVGEAPDGLAALEAVERLHPSVVLLDVQLPGMDGIEVAERLARAVEPPLVVLISSYDASVYGDRLAVAPVRGFIPKSKLSGDALARLVG